MMTGKEIQKWADEAMFTAEPSNAAEGPRVYLLWATPDPLGAVAAMAKMYKGEVVRDMATVTDDERRFYFDQIEKTKLKAPYESVKFHFLIEGVTRGFTHQLVRQRTAVYAQESMRFAVKEDMASAVALPPSLMGTLTRLDRVRRTAADMFPDRDLDSLSSSEYMLAANLTDSQETKADRWRDQWDDAVDTVSQVYNWLVNDGMPAEDARGLAPTNITTRIEYITDLRSLLDHGGNRLCTQAQFEWKQVWAEIIHAIRGYSLGDGYMMTRAAEGSTVEGGYAWQFEEISRLFKPACYLTGKCEFAAMDLDRKCNIRSRVDDFARHGIPSEEWHQPHSVDAGLGDYRRRDLIPIHPREWADDPAAAR